MGIILSTYIYRFNVILTILIDNINHICSLLYFHHTPIRLQIYCTHIHTQKIHTGRVRESESIFVYKGSDTYTNVNDDTDFTPQFGVDLGSIPEDVRESCGNNTQCLFDYQQTGNLELAMSTASEQERLNSVRTVLS